MNQIPGSGLMSRLSCKQWLLASTLLWTSSHGLSQVKINSPVDNLIPPSPEAAALGKYVSVPVGLYTGIPNIEIPLYELRSGDLSLPLSLSYHAGGHKPDEFAARTGLGWVLNAGGTISRTIVGSADEYGYNGLLENSKTMNPGNFYLGSNAELFDRYYQATQCADVNPDQFTFNAAGISGSFAFNWSSNLLVNADRQVIVKPITIPSGAQATYIPGWEITDDKGTVYTFTAQETNQALPTGIYSCNYLTPPVTSWHITKIRSVNGHEMNFWYEPYSLNYTIVASESVMHREGWENGQANRSLQPMSIKGQYLNKITTSDGYTVRIISGAVKRTDLPVNSSNAFPLEQVIVTNQEGREISHFKAVYDYSLGRLTLKNLQELPAPGSTDAAKPPYQFTYTGSVPEIPMDNVIGFFKQDHWGFLNDNTKSTLLPAYTITHNGNELTFEGANREPSVNGSTAGLLTKITYPAGGSSSFEYELNDYSAVSGVPLYKYEIQKKSRSSRHPGSTKPVFDLDRHFTSESFTILPNIDDENPIKVKISVSMGYCSGTFAQADLAPYARLLKANGELIRIYYYSETSISDSLLLPPGDYIIETSTWHKACTNGGWDNCYASVSWEEKAARVSTNKPAGGARIKRITDYDGINTANNIIRRFVYRQSGADSLLSTGTMGVEPEYVYTLYMHEGPEFANYVNSVLYKCRQSSSAIPTALTQGCHIGYSRVAVLYGENGEGGKTESVFQSFNEVHDDLNRDFPFAPHTSFDYRRGLLLSETDYKAESGNFIPVRKTENTYTYKLDQVVGYKVGKKVVGGGLWNSSTLSRFSTADYKLVLGRNKPKTSTITTYENGRAYVQETSYQYDPELHYLLSETSKIHENKEQIIEYTYPFQYAVTTGPLAEMKAKNIVSPVIEEIQRQKGPDGSVTTLSASFNEFSLVNNIPLRTSTWQTESTAPIPDFRSSLSYAGSIDTRFYKQKIHYNKYNDKGMPLQVSTYGTDTACMIFAYNGITPIASVTNATFNKCAFTGFETADQGNWTYGDLPENYSPAARTGNRSFHGNITSKELPAGKYTVSLWSSSESGGSITVNGQAQTVSGSWKRYQWILDNPGAITIATGSNLIDDLRLHPVGSQMKTFTHIQGIGLTSITDENNHTTFYEYDDYGRLKTTRNDEGNITHHYRYQYK